MKLTPFFVPTFARLITPAFLISGYFLLFSASADAQVHTTLDSTTKTYFSSFQIANDSCYDPILYDHVCHWIGTPYQYAGKTMEGIDCSSFAKKTYLEIYDTNIVGTSSSLFNNCVPIEKEYLQEGDLLFFKIDLQRISHVGIYLANHKFVHASTSLGVTISDLREKYYSTRFFSGGRIGILSKNRNFEPNGD